jgi:hypothetical protein
MIRLMEVPDVFTILPGCSKRAKALCDKTTEVWLRNTARTLIVKMLDTYKSEFRRVIPNQSC